MDYSKIRIESMYYSGSEERWLLTTENNRYIIKSNFALKVKALLEAEDKEEFLSKMSDKEREMISKLLSQEPQGKKRSSMWLKTTLLNEKMIGKLGVIFSFMFNKTAAISVISLFVFAFAYALLFTNSLNYFGLDIKTLTGKSYILAGVLGVLGVFIHELGHITASIKYGSVPKSMGIGIYFTSPVVYVDVDDSWKLKKKERVVVDIGGVYFQAIYTAILLIAFLFTKSTVCIILAFMFTTSLIFNLNPFLKYDGYWFLSDLLGIYNLNQKFPIVIRACIKYIFGKKEAFKKLREVWAKNILLTIFAYGIISMIFYVYFSYKIFAYIFSSIMNIANINTLNLIITIFFIVIGVKSIIALFKLMMQIFTNKEDTM